MTNRLKKWAKKLSGDNRKRLYDAQKPQMIKLEAEATKELVKIENEVKKLVEGEPTFYLPYYIIFGKEIYKLRKKYIGLTLIIEAEILVQKWENRGLDIILLEKIKIFYLGTRKSITYFQFDLSLLDGQDILA